MENNIGKYDLRIGETGELENWMCDEMVLMANKPQRRRRYEPVNLL